LIKASLPSFDPKQQLTFDFIATARVGGSSGFGSQANFYPFIVELWSGDFVGWVSSDASLVVAPGSQGAFTFRTQVQFGLPESVGLTGREGWFRLTALGEPFVFVTDCIVTYTPSGTPGTSSSQGYFS